MRLQFWIFLAAVWVVSCLVLFPAAYSPWHGLDREILAAPFASLRSLDHWSLFQRAPGEFLGWWSLAEQHRLSPNPLSFRLVNFFLVSSLVLFLALVLAGEDLQDLLRRKDALWEILPPVALFAFHPFLNDLIANAFTRPILLAAFWATIAFLLLRRALAGEHEQPASLLFGVLFYLLALGCHPAAMVVLAALTWPILFQARPVPRNREVLVLLFLVSLVDLALGLGLGESWGNFFRSALLHPVAGEVRVLTLVAAFFPNPHWNWSWLLALALAFAVLLFAWGFGPRLSARPSQPPHWFWHVVYLLGLLGAAIPLWQLPGIYLAGPLLLSFFSYGIIRRLRMESFFPETITRVAALVCGIAALCFLGLSAERAWTYQKELDRARGQVSNFPESPLAWQDLGLALIAENQGQAGRALLVRTAARFPDDFQVRLALVETALAQGQLDAAKSFLDSLQKDAPDRWEVLFYLCALTSRQAELTDAAGYCQAAIRDRPDSALALNYLATVDLRRQQFSEAEALLGQARRLEPRNASVLNNLGYLAEQRQDLDHALAHYRQAARLNPDQTLYLKNIARVYFLRQQIPETVAALEAVLRREPGNVQVHANLAKIFYQMGDQRRARAQIEAVLRIAPDSPEAVEMYQLRIKIGPAPGPTRPRHRVR